ncbi:MAG: PIN domain nuclease [Ignavibacteriae bacterium]|nr:PIN domain nuclease [Ignavibacteriota bacterium]
MILVETSVLIDFFKGKDTQASKKLSEVIDQNIPFGICSLVYLELLQGAKNEKEFDFLNEYLSTQIFYHLNDIKKSYLEASKIKLKCNKKGVTIRSTIDLLIAQIAIDNNLYLLHNDKDFNNIAKVVDLKLY